MQRAQGWVLGLSLVLACGEGADKPAPKPAASVAPTENQPSEPADKRRIATLAPPGTPWMRILTRGAKRVAEATEGRVQVDFFFGGVQGGERDMVRKMKLGQLDGAALTSVGLGMIYPGIRVLQLPGMYDSVEELDYVRERSWPYFQQQFREKGFELRDTSDVGWVHLLSKREIKSMKDLRAAKMWLWTDDPVSKKVFERLGIDGVPLGVPDVLPALKTDRIDAVYGSPLVAIALQWYTEIQHITMLRISYGIGAMVVRVEAWENTSEADRAVEARISRDTSLELIARIRKDNERALEAMKKFGIKTVGTGTRFPKQLRAVNRKVWQDLIGELYTQEELDMILAYRKEFRDRKGCPPLAALEDLHAVLAMIERGAPAGKVKQRLERARASLEGKGIDAAWKAFAERAERMAAAYQAGKSEEAKIEEAALRMELQDSRCFVKQVHDVMHQRLGM